MLPPGNQSERRGHGQRGFVARDPQPEEAQRDEKVDCPTVGLSIQTVRKILPKKSANLNYL